MNQEMLEIMIGKHLDGEIEPSEQRLLDAELDLNPQAGELLEQLQELHERCGEAVGSELLGRGGTPEEVFERAWNQDSKRSPRAIARLRGHLRFAAGLAAGLIIGLALHFVLPVFSPPVDDAAGRDIAVQTPESKLEIDRTQFTEFASDPGEDVVRKVDWYGFTDKQGNKWIVEGLREDIIKPAVYEKDL